MHSLKQKILDVFSAANHTKSPEAETNLILFHVLRSHYPEIKKPQDIYLSVYKTTPSIDEEAIEIAKDRASGKPLQHLLGYQFFYGHEYKISQSVLVPRPETEILVSQIETHARKFFGDQAFTFAELGLGSGIISIEILSHFRNARGLASEYSIKAKATAEENLQAIIGPSWKNRFQILAPTTPLHAFEIFMSKGPFDFVISNPPYVSNEDEIEAEVLKHEPRLALFPESDNPNYFYENFLMHGPRLLKPHGVGFFEVPHERADHLKKLFMNAGFKNSVLIPDLTGRPRLLIAQK